ncbi:hypothetical protein [Bacillus sp. AK031]
MKKEMMIERLITIDESLEDLTDLLIRAVNDGAAIGFLPPLDFPLILPLKRLYFPGYLEA